MPTSGTLDVREVLVLLIAWRAKMSISSVVIESTLAPMVNDRACAYSYSQFWVSPPTSIVYDSCALSAVIDGATVHVLLASAPVAVLPPSSWPSTNGSSSNWRPISGLLRYWRLT